MDVSSGVPVRLKRVVGLFQGKDGFKGVNGGLSGLDGMNYDAFQDKRAITELKAVNL